MSGDPDQPEPKGLGDILGRWRSDSNWRPEPPPAVAAPETFEQRVRVLASELGEDPEKLLKKCTGKSLAARLVRLLIGEKNPRRRISSDQKTYEVYLKVYNEGLRGEPLWSEVAHRRKRTVETVKRTHARYLGNV